MFGHIKQTCELEKMISPFFEALLCEIGGKVNLMDKKYAGGGVTMTMTIY